MPEYPPGQNYCHASKPGWMNSTHPTSIGETKAVQICYRTSASPCGEWEEGASVTNCGRYYVYWLNGNGFEGSCDRGYCAVKTV